MASALIGGLAKKFVHPKNIYASDPYEPSRERVKEYGINVTTSNIEVVNKSNIIFLCVKPNMVPVICKEIKNSVKDYNKKLFISIAAGVLINVVEQELDNTKIIRVMPNTPCLVQESASGYIGNKFVEESDLNLVHDILSSVGIAVRLKNEYDIDAVIGVSGSGPGKL